MMTDMNESDLVPGERRELTMSYHDGRTRRVLVVDDHPLLREGIAAVVQRQPDMQIVGEAENLVVARVGAIGERCFQRAFQQAHTDADFFLREAALGIYVLMKIMLMVLLLMNLIAR